MYHAAGATYGRRAGEFIHLWIYLWLDPARRSARPEQLLDYAQGLT